MAQATQHNSTQNGDFYLVDERQFCRLALFHQALTGLARIAEGTNLDEGEREMSIHRDQLAALFDVLAEHLQSIAGNMPLKGQ